MWGYKTKSAQKGAPNTIGCTPLSRRAMVERPKGKENIESGGVPGGVEPPALSVDLQRGVEPHAHWQEPGESRIRHIRKQQTGPGAEPRGERPRHTAEIPMFSRPFFMPLPPHATPPMRPAQETQSRVATEPS